MTTKSDAGMTGPVGEWTDPDDAPELTEAFFADAEVFKGDTFLKRGRGRPPTGNAKEQVSIRLDRDVLAKLREFGPGWQSRVSGLLRYALTYDLSSTVEFARKMEPVAVANEHGPIESAGKVRGG